MFKEIKMFKEITPCGEALWGKNEGKVHASLVALWGSLGEGKERKT